MNLCDSIHEEICYNSKLCPLCAAINEKDDIEKEKSDLEAEMETLKNDFSSQIDDLNNVIAYLRNRCNE